MRISEVGHKFLVAAMAAGVLSLGLAGCGGDGADGDSATTDSSSSDSSDAESEGLDRIPGSGPDGVPDGFPDVPLPEFTTAKALSEPSDTSDLWSLFLTTPDADAAVKDYVGMLTTEGYSVEEGAGGSWEAVGPEWSISFHSAAQGTLNLYVTQA